MLSTPQGQVAEKKRGFVNVSPDLEVEEAHEQKRLDTKASPLPVMASLNESTAIETLDEKSEKMEYGEKVPPWAILFQKQFFDKLDINTKEVSSLKNVTADLKKSLDFLHGRADDMDKEKDKLIARAKTSEAKVAQLEQKCEDMSKKLDKIEEKVLRGEIRDKHNNLIFHGLMEKHIIVEEKCSDTVAEFLKTTLKINDEMKIGRCHRLGTKVKGNNMTGRPRPIIASFTSAHDRNTVWKMKTQLKDTNYYISPDLPREIEDRRAKLLPVFKIAKSIDKYRPITYLTEDRLTIDKKQYNVNNLHTLPPELNPAKAATQTIGDVTIFFTSQSPLSNHYMGAPFDIHGKKYSCTEQFYFSSKADAYGDNDAYKAVMKASNPAKMLQEGRKATNHTGIEWEKLRYGKMLEGNLAKYNQNPEAREALRSTGTTKLGEASANKQSAFWNTGYSLFHKDRGNSNLWSGDNKMGEILSQIRLDLPKEVMDTDTG